MTNFRMATINGFVAATLFLSSLSLPLSLAIFPSPSHRHVEAHVAWILLWPALVYTALCIAYSVSNGAKVFCKRSDGSIPISLIVLFLPFYGPAIIILFLRRWLILDRKENPYDEIAQGLYVGRFCLHYPREFPEDTKLVIDLTAELPARKVLLKDRQYICLPSLDCDMPATKDLVALAQTVAKFPLDQKIFIHCANGHGRSASFAALVMVLRGNAVSWQEAFQKMQQTRPSVHCHRVQQAILDVAQGMLVPSDLSNLQKTYTKDDQMENSLSPKSMIYNPS